MNQTSRNDTPANCCCGDVQGKSPCCGVDSSEMVESNEHWITGSIDTSVGPVPRVSTRLTIYDTIGTWKARWGIGRMNYKVTPGLYCVGQPDQLSPVLVTANYKMSFDRLRQELSGRNIWLLVLDTKGINVWCAAGKGTFGTDELVSRITMVNLSKHVSHKTLVLPQLGAPGIVAHEVQSRSGFRVVYGPVRANDIQEFLDAGMKATAEMRQVKFTFYDRLVLTPIELVGTIKVTLMIFGVLFMLNLLHANSFGAVDFYAYIGALFAGCFFVPVLLPWIPGTAFSLKGWFLGIIWAVGVNIFNGGLLDPGYGLLKALAYMLLLPAISAYYAMNFTGSSTYTSFSGVLKEMKIAVPAIMISLFIGMVLILFATFNLSGGW